MGKIYKMYEIRQDGQNKQHRLLHTAKRFGYVRQALRHNPNRCYVTTDGVMTHSNYLADSATIAYVPYRFSFTSVTN